MVLHSFKLLYYLRCHWNEYFFSFIVMTCSHWDETKSVVSVFLSSRSNLPLRMIILWPAFLCLVTRSPSPPTVRTYTRTTSSNCISSPTSTISDQRANTLSTGAQSWSHKLTFPEVLCRFFFTSCSSCSFGLILKHLSLAAGGWRSSAAPRSRQAAPVSWTAKSPVPTEPGRLVFQRATSSGRHLPVLSLALTSCFSFFSTHIWDICPCVHAHLVLFNALMVTCPLV